MKLVYGESMDPAQIAADPVRSQATNNGLFPVRYFGSKLGHKEPLVPELTRRKEHDERLTSIRAGSLSRWF